MKKCFALIVGLMLVQAAAAEVETRGITYSDGTDVMQGYLAYDPELIPPLGNPEGASAPGVLIVHQWMGLTEYEQGRARQLAEMGYVVFALDIYGVENRPANQQEAGQMAGRFKNDRALFRARLNFGLEILKNNPLVDSSRIVAIGYCFGGTGVLELARSGADIAGAVSFHGGLDSPAPEDGANIQCPILICHGADDPFVPRAGIDAMRAEFDAADVDWQMISYSGAVHAFTQPMAGDDPTTGAAYNEQADTRSWQHMQLFFHDVLDQ